jgi:hypothetical protein
MNIPSFPNTSKNSRRCRGVLDFNVNDGNELTLWDYLDTLTDWGTRNIISQAPISNI